jgi:hypothetical protein
MPDRWIDEHAGDEVRPRPDFEDELETTLRNAWHGASAPVIRPLTAPPRRQVSWRLVGAFGAAAALVAVLAVVVTSRNDSSTPVGPASTSAPLPTTAVASTSPNGATVPPVPPTTNAAVTTAPISTTASPETTTTGTEATTTSPETTVPSVPASAPGPQPPADPGHCTEVVGIPASHQAADQFTDGPFGPLALSPALTVATPMDMRGIATIIPGGVLIDLQTGSGGEIDEPSADAPRTMLAAVNTDGSIRWARCLDDPGASWHVLQGATLLDAYALVAKTTDSPGGTTDEWQMLSLSDGAISGSLASAIADRNPQLGAFSSTGAISVSEERVMLGPSSEQATSDHLVLADRDTLAAVAIPYPDSSARPDGSFAPTGFNDMREPAVFGSAPGEPEIIAVYRDGAWITDPAQVAAGTDTVTFAPEGLRAVDGTGAVLWTNPRVREAFFAEGFGGARSGDVTVVAACVAMDASNADCDPSIVGVRSADGVIVWTLAGARMVSVVADGYALVDDVGSSGFRRWILIDTDSGEAVPGQAWDDPAAFLQLCCDGGEHIRVYREGGVLAAVNQGRVALWFPEAAGLPSATASLP